MATVLDIPGLVGGQKLQKIQGRQAKKEGKFSVNEAQRNLEQVLEQAPLIPRRAEESANARGTLGGTQAQSDTSRAMNLANRLTASATERKGLAKSRLKSINSQIKAQRQLYYQQLSMVAFNTVAAVYGLDTPTGGGQTPQTQYPQGTFSDASLG